jgi:hypothetical protein
MTQKVCCIFCDKYILRIDRRDQMKKNRGSRVAAIVTGAILLCAGIGTIGGSTSVNPSAATTAQTAPSSTATQATPSSTTANMQSTASSAPPSSNTTVTPAPNTGATDTNLSNNNTYTNSDGNTVHSLATSTDNTTPAGATARCGDGSYSFSQHRSGTCSHHGGVATWL